MQEVIEAIAAGLYEEYMRGRYYKHEFPDSAGSFTAKAQKILDALTYPSGHPMIALLDDDQTFPPFLTHKGMSCEEIVQTTRQSMYDKHWRKTLGGK